MVTGPGRRGNCRAARPARPGSSAPPSGATSPRADAGLAAGRSFPNPRPERPRHP